MYRAIALGLALILVALGVSAEATTFPAASCSRTDVGTAYGLASDGDIVTIPAGTCNWTSTLTVTKAIEVNGAGLGVTILVDEVPRPSNASMFDFQVTGTAKLWRLSNMTLKGGTVTQGAGSIVGINGNSYNFRIDHIRFENLKGRYFWPAGDVRGVIDHNQFFDQNSNGMLIYHLTWGGVGGSGDNSWATPTNFGSGDFIFLEDNTVECVNFLCGWIDSAGGGRWVARYNTLTNSVFTSHGTDSTGRTRGVRAVEIYNNTITKPGGFFAAMEFRSGTGVIHSNTLVGFGVGNSMVVGSNYRDYDNHAPWGTADGSSPYDQNDGVAYASGTHTGGASTTLTDSSKSFTTNQWVGAMYSIRNTTQSWGSYITANTATTISSAGSGFGQNRTWQTGDAYQILRAYPAIDQPGRGQGDLLSGGTPTPAAWPNQALEPIYVWNNTIGSASAASAGGIHVAVGRDIITSAKPGYVPFVYPHPLVTGSPPPPPPPSPPTNRLFIWSPGLGGDAASAYVVACGLVSSTVSAPTTELLVNTLLQAPGQYQCAVRAENQWGTSVSSGAIPVTVQGNPPATPTNFRVETR